MYSSSYIYRNRVSSVHFRLPLAVTQPTQASRFRFSEPKSVVPCSFAPTSGIDKVGTFTPARATPITAVLTCLLSEHRRDREGQAGRKCSHPPLLVLYGGPHGTGTVVSPPQQVLTFIGTDVNVQNCQGTSTQLLSGVVPANTPPSP